VYLSCREVTTVPWSYWPVLYLLLTPTCEISVIQTRAKAKPSTWWGRCWWGFFCLDEFFCLTAVFFSGYAHGRHLMGHGSLSTGSICNKQTNKPTMEKTQVFPFDEQLCGRDLQPMKLISLYSEVAQEYSRPTPLEIWDQSSLQTQMEWICDDLNFLFHSIISQSQGNSPSKPAQGQGNRAMSQDCNAMVELNAAVSPFLSNVTEVPVLFSQLLDWIITRCFHRVESQQSNGAGDRQAVLALREPRCHLVYYRF